MIRKFVVRSLLQCMCSLNLTSRHFHEYVTAMEIVYVRCWNVKHCNKNVLRMFSGTSWYYRHRYESISNFTTKRDSILEEWDNFYKSEYFSRDVTVFASFHQSSPISNSFFIFVSSFVSSFPRNDIYQARIHTSFASVHVHIISSYIVVYVLIFTNVFMHFGPGIFSSLGRQLRTSITHINV